MLLYFLASLMVIIAPHLKSLFVSNYGWSHRLFGALMMSWLIFGSFQTEPYIDNERPQNWAIWCLVYDIVLSCLGILTTLSAARDFPHKLVSNAPGQSGTLAEVAIVTQSEMIEHSFYQLLNLIHALFLHFISWPRLGQGMLIGHRMTALFIVSVPWVIRKRFPVHSFSSNWNTIQFDNPRTKRVLTSTTKHQENKLYRVKKWQYLFYKHFILHGLNISMATFPPQTINPSSPIPQQPHLCLPFSRHWRIFWLSLNASYVLEFFLQTLVKRSIISQRSMLRFQFALMSIATVSAVKSGALFGGCLVIGHRPISPIISFFVRLIIASVSLLLNFYNRGYDLLNTLSISIVTMIISCRYPR
jgi:hypothetical protein